VKLLTALIITGKRASGRLQGPDLLGAIVAGGLPFLRIDEQRASCRRFTAIPLIVCLFLKQWNIV